MRMFCKCGYFMTDVIVPNRTNLRLKNSSHNNLSETKIMIFHCECCHRLHIFSLSDNAKFFVYWLDKVFLSKQDKNPIPSEQYGSYITDDYGGAYPIIFTDETRQILLNYYDKIAVFRLESVSENHHLIYHENHSEKILYDKSTVDMSLSAHQIRCPCGWLINLQLIDDESIIYLYDLVNWASRVKYEFGELRNFQHLIGLYCKKCKRIMLPAKEQKYATFLLTNKKFIDKDFRLFYYYVKPNDEFMIDFEKYRDEPTILKKIYISDDGEYIHFETKNANLLYKIEPSEDD